MRAAEILRKLADIVDSAEQEKNTSEIDRRMDNNTDLSSNTTVKRLEPVPEPENDTGDDDKMVPPLQQKHELLKKVAGVDNEYDREEASDSDNSDELDRMKKMAGIVIADDESDIN